MQQRNHVIAAPFALALVVAIAAPAMLQAYGGFALRIVRTGSMQPAIKPGDAAIVRATRVEQLHPRDIAVLFHPGDGEATAHRILTLDVTTDGVDIVTKGDANPASDPVVRVPRNIALEQVLLVIPNAGYALAVLGSPLVLASWCALGLIVLVVAEIQVRRRRLPSPSAEPQPTTVRSA